MTTTPKPVKPEIPTARIIPWDDGFRVLRIDDGRVSRYKYRSSPSARAAHLSAGITEWVEPARARALDRRKRR